MKILISILAVVVLIVAGYFTWNYLDGPIKYRRDMSAFADSLAKCEPFSRPIKMILTGQSDTYTIKGMNGDLCPIIMETLGPDEIHCDFAAKDLAALSVAYRDFAYQVDIFGGWEYSYSSSNPDYLTQMLNSDACNNLIP